MVCQLCKIGKFNLWQVFVRYISPTFLIKSESTRNGKLKWETSCWYSIPHQLYLALMDSVFNFYRVILQQQVQWDKNVIATQISANIRWTGTLVLFSTWPFQRRLFNLSKSHVGSIRLHWVLWLSCNTYGWQRLTKSLSVVLGFRPRIYRLVRLSCSPDWLWLLDWLLVVLGLAAGMLRGV